MNERPRGLSKGESIAQLLNEAFPNLRCLRCGYDAFALTYDLEAELSSRARTSLLVAATDLKPEQIDDLDDAMLRDVLDAVFITLVCERCGMIERHLRPTLERSEKPIVINRVHD